MLNLKKVCFFSILLLPLFLLFGLVSSVAFGIYRIRHIDYGKIQVQLKDYLDKEKGKAHVLMKNDIMYIDYEYYIKDGPYKPSYRQFSFKYPKDNYLIYIYGPSFLSSAPTFFKGDFPFFPSLLESRLNISNKKKGFTVINFGMEGLDSFDIKEIIKETVNCRKPDLIIYYDLSASDFECAYFSCIKKNFYLVSNFLKRLSGLFILRRPPQIGGLNRLADWFLRAYVEPNLINLAQRLKLIEFQEGPFKEYNELIFSYYKRNIYDIIKFTQNKNIPLIALTPLSNLEARLYGIYNLTDKYYQQGMKEKDYDKKIEYLTKAKDTEIFNGELAAKSYIYTFLRNLKEKNVYVFDLQRKLMDIKFDFDYKNFYDYGHMKPYSHKLIADYLYEFLINNEDINSHFSS